MNNIISFLLISIVIIVSSCAGNKNLVTTGSESPSAPQLSSDYGMEIAHHREKYKAEFLKNERSPLKKEDFKDMHFYPADEAFRCKCTFNKTPDAKPFEMATYSGKTKPFKKFGIATCIINDKETDVNIYSSLRVQAMPGYADYLFIPFKDETNSEETYGGGRYIDIVKGDILNNKVVLDFNKSYNPWCAYSDGYNCPIPPLENHLNTKITSGEKMWTGEKKH